MKVAHDLFTTASQGFPRQASTEFERHSLNLPFSLTLAVDSVPLSRNWESTCSDGRPRGGLPGTRLLPALVRT